MPAVPKFGPLVGALGGSLAQQLLDNTLAFITVLRPLHALYSSLVRHSLTTRVDNCVTAGYAVDVTSSLK